MGEGRNFKKSVNIGNQWKKWRKCLILMLKLKVSKQARSEASTNKVTNNQKSIKHTNKPSKSKKIINQTSFRILQKSTLQQSHAILNWQKNIT